MYLSSTQIPFQTKYYFISLAKYFLNNSELWLYSSSNSIITGDPSFSISFFFTFSKNLWFMISSMLNRLFGLNNKVDCKISTAS